MFSRCLSLKQYKDRNCNYLSISSVLSWKYIEVHRKSGEGGMALLVPAKPI
jgi:hypothetical protein